MSTKKAGEALDAKCYDTLDGTAARVGLLWFEGHGLRPFNVCAPSL